MKRIVLTSALVAPALALAGFAVAASGLIPIKASDGHWPFTSWFLRFSMHRSMATHGLGLKVPPLDDPDLVLKGATHFDVSCRGCHGAPGAPPARVSQTMLPRPADLAPRVPELSPRQLFQIVKHGVKFTGMPAFPSQQRDDEVWAVVAFLQMLPRLDPAGYRQLVHGAERDNTPSAQEMSAAARLANQSCAQCHGANGQGRGEAIPALAGQRTAYLEQALRAYREGRRHSGIMEPIAAPLDRAAMQALVAHYAALPPRAVTAPPAPERDQATARAIAEQGVPARRIPACLECHGPAGRRVSPEHPVLSGQSARYLETQLLLFHQDRRGGGARAHLMQPVATRLTPEEMKALARYFSAQPPATGDPR
jgi:cytochrome c553